MNKELERFARETILDGLKELPEKSHFLFKRMYSHKNLEASIEDVVANMDIERLDHAMTQISNTREKRNGL